MSSLDDRERYLLIGLGILAFAIAVWYWILPTYYRYSSLKSKIDENVNKIRKARAQVTQLKQLVKKLKTTKKELKAAKRKLPERGRFNQLMSTLEQHARNAGIPGQKILTFSRGGVSSLQDGLLSEMTIQARFEKITMAQLVTMLWRYDNMTRMVDVKKFNSSDMKLPGDNSTVRFNLNLTLAVYMLEDEQSAGDQGESA